MAFNANLARRLLARSTNMGAFVYAYNKTKGIQPLAKSTLYKKIKGMDRNFIRGDKSKTRPATVVDRFLSDISLGRRINGQERKAILSNMGISQSVVCPICQKNYDVTLCDFDHINGNHNDTRVGNMQLICRTCHISKTMENGDNQHGRYVA